MKAVFWTLLLISVLAPIYNVASALQTLPHNQYEGRFDRLRSTTDWSRYPSLHLGLTAPELAALPKETRDAYEDAVYDGYRVGRGYSILWLESMALDGLLFVSSVLGLWSCRLRRQSPNHAMERTADSRTI